MSVCGGPSISRDGMVLYLDPANNKSFGGEPTENLLLYTDGLIGGSWAGYCGNQTNVTGNTTDVMAPDGTFTATRIVRNDVYTCGSSSGWGLYWNSTATVVSGSVYTTSVYARVASGSVTVTYGLTDGATANATITPTWSRLTYTATASSTARGLQIVCPSMNVTYYVWGAQLEQKGYATSYVPSEASRGTRSGNITSIGTAIGYTGSMSGIIRFDSGSVGSLLLDKATGYVNLGNIPVTTNLTLCMWVKPTSTTDGQCFFGKNSAAGGNVFLFGYWGSGYNIDISVAGQIGVGTKTSGVWQHLALQAVDNGNTTTSMYLYRDGVYVGTTTIATVISSATGTTQLGMEYDGAAPSDFFGGNVSTVQLYNRVLTTDEIVANYNASKSRFGR